MKWFCPQRQSMMLSSFDSLEMSQGDDLWHAEKGLAWIGFVLLLMMNSSAGIQEDEMLSARSYYWRKHLENWRLITEDAAEEYAGSCGPCCQTVCQLFPFLPLEWPSHGVRIIFAQWGRFRFSLMPAKLINFIPFFAPSHKTRSGVRIIFAQWGHFWFSLMPAI